MRFQFEWDPDKAISNVRKHRVSFDEAAEVFLDPLAVTTADIAHGEMEERWVTVGAVRNRYLLVVAHTWRESTETVHIRIISARPATNHETRQYQG